MQAVTNGAWSVITRGSVRGLRLIANAAMAPNGDERGADHHGGIHAVDELLARAVPAVDGEHQGQHGVTEHAAELTDGVVGSGGPAFLFGTDGGQHDVRDGREDQRDGAARREPRTRIPARSARSRPGQRRPRRDRVGSSPCQRRRLDLGWHSPPASRSQSGSIDAPRTLCDAGSCSCRTRLTCRMERGRISRTRAERARRSYFTAASWIRCLTCVSPTSPERCPARSSVSFTSTTAASVAATSHTIPRLMRCRFGSGTRWRSSTSSASRGRTSSASRGEGGLGSESESTRPTACARS